MKIQHAIVSLACKFKDMRGNLSVTSDSPKSNMRTTFRGPYSYVTVSYRAHTRSTLSPHSNGMLPTIAAAITLSPHSSIPLTHLTHSSRRTVCRGRRQNSKPLEAITALTRPVTGPSLGRDKALTWPCGRPKPIGGFTLPSTGPVAGPSLMEGS